MNKKNKNKKINGFNKYYILILVLIVVIGIISATYAFFQIDTNSSDYEPTTITANTDCFSIEFEDLSQDGLNNLDVNYPITDEYALGKTDSIYNLKPIVVKISNKCTNIQDNLNYKLAITTLAKDSVNEQDKGYIPDNKVRYNVKRAFKKVTEEDSNNVTEEDSYSLNNPDYLSNLTLLKDENIKSLLNEEITKKEINLKNYNTVNTYIIDSDSLASNSYRTYYLRLWIDYYEGDAAAYVDSKNHVKGNEYDNSTEGQKFESVISLIADGTTTEPTINILREKDTQGYLSKDKPGGMYRYQASFEESDSSEMSNWVCFGTRDNCGTNDDSIDKYMYRIIGITEEGQLYLLKETFLKEGDATKFAWNDKYYTSGEYEYTCDNKICPEWGQNNLFKRLNGTSNGETQGTGSYEDNADTDIFVDSAQYDYLKSGDNVNGTSSPSEWYNLIAYHEWMYGDANEDGFSSTNAYNGDYMYAIESGKAETTHYVGTDGKYTEETYTWNQSVTAKINLMYIHDYIYSYPGGNPGNKNTVKNEWLFFQKDGYNTSSSEWLSTRWGIYSDDDPQVYARYVNDDGTMNRFELYKTFGVRPVFYLSSKAKISSGDGTKDSPFLLG